jgi:hypothetical protein
MQLVAGLALLVQGMQNDPNLTMSFIEGLSPSFMKAELLVGAASALSLRRLPFSSRPQQKVEKLPESRR